ncbi:MAG TPA: alpha/beta family hydrolase, partial [Candidatus Binatus sp.]|nr:alpha/beta family hydrolase [Candidatus Binatus sp.]
MSLVYGMPSRAGHNGVCVVIAHGAGGPMYSPFITYFHSELARRGFLSVKFNFPYMEARRRVPDRRDVLEDSYRRVVEHVRIGPYSPSKFFVGGKSMGG